MHQPQAFQVRTALTWHIPPASVFNMLKAVQQVIIIDGKVYMNLKVVLEPSEEGGYTAYVPSLSGCISEGESKDGALHNIKEAVELYLEPYEDRSLSARRTI